MCICQYSNQFQQQQSTWKYRSVVVLLKARSKRQWPTQRSISTPTLLRLHLCLYPRLLLVRLLAYTMYSVYCLILRLPFVIEHASEVIGSHIGSYRNCGMAIIKRAAGRWKRLEDGAQQWVKHKVELHMHIFIGVREQSLNRRQVTLVGKKYSKAALCKIGSATVMWIYKAAGSMSVECLLFA